MRLWHYELLPYLPRQQLLAQWRELNVLFNADKKHILWNYVYEYDPVELLRYASLVIYEMNNRGYKVKDTSGLRNYCYRKNIDEINVDLCLIGPVAVKVFEKHHTNQYLLQCFFNLQEKFNRGQDCQDYMEKMTLFVTGKFSERRLYDLIMFEK